jgi:thiamine-monophosphate kinase
MPAIPSTSSDRGFGAAGPRLDEVGEAQLLERLMAVAAAVPSATPPVARSGDDAAIWTPPAGRDLAVTIDALVEGVDFRREWITPRQLGRRAFAVAVSDIAGMGADPIQCVATLCARPDEQLEDVLDLQRGLCEAAAAAGCAVVGGDVSATDGPLVIDVCITGALPPGRALRRSAGRPGDLLLTTGVLGRAAAGLRLLLDAVPPATAVERSWVEAQRQPPSRLAEGRRLLELGVGCGGDISDGLLVDAARTARASGCAAELWADGLPVDEELRRSYGSQWLELAVGGGEDFELGIAVPGGDVDALLARWPTELAPLTVVGQLIEGAGLRVLDTPGGSEIDVAASRADHFR